jgi:uncharacterized protein YqeY
MMQLSIIKEYAPQMITNVEDIQFMIVEAINGEFALTPANRGLVMKTVMPILKSKNCDMKVAQTVINNMLK